MKNMSAEFNQNIKLMERLEVAGGCIDMVLDTDTYNEIDDQFALAYAMLSPERLNVQAVYAAPFSNDLAASPGEGMEKSYDEILRVLGRLGVNPGGLVFKGSTRYLGSLDTPCKSAAALDLVERAMSATKPLYVVAIAAITNIASALLIEPRIAEKIVVVWLGGNTLSWPHTGEFNLMQDIPASSHLFDCGVPVIHVPCMAVASHLTASVQELEHYIGGKSAVGTYLSGIFKDHCTEHGRITKEIWDISAVAAVLEPDWVQTEVIHSPILTEKLTYSADMRRHFIKSAYWLNRDAIFEDMYRKIASC
jgi:hypothetical protein